MFMVKGAFIKVHNKIKFHLWFLIILLIITTIHFSVLFTSKMPYSPADKNLTSWNQHDNIYFYFPMLMRIYQEIKEGNYYPLWNKYTLAGSPLMADPEVSIFNFPLLYMLMGIDPYLSDNLGILTRFLLAGIFMYLFVNLITKSREAAFVSALAYANGGYFVWDLIAGAYAFIQAMSFLPLVLICFYYVIFTDKYIIASLFTALSLVMAATYSATIFVYFTIFGFLFWATFLIMAKNKKKMFKKYIISAIIIIPLFLGLIAYKALPAKEYIELTERGGEGISFEEAHRGWAVKDLAIIDPWISTKYNRQNFRDIYLGLIPFILVCFAVFFKFKNKWVILLSFTTLILVLASFGDRIFYLFYKFYPMIYNMRRPQRFLTIANLTANILVGFGYLAFFSKFGKTLSIYLSNKFKHLSLFLNKITKNSLTIKDKLSYFNWSFILVVALIILNLNISSFGLNYVDMGEQISKNEVMTFISKQPGIFRMHVWEMIGQEYGMEHFTQPLKLQHLYGFVTVWEIDYMNIFMSISFQSSAKIWGMLNTKYIMAMSPLNVSGFKFINKFKECPSCNPLKAAGPYLYENEKYLPRAYITNNAVLVYGKNKQNVQQLTYGLILTKEFNPQNMIVISTDKEKDMNDPEFISKFKALFLTEMPPSESILKKYKKEGGKIFPDIFEGKTEINTMEISEFFDLLNNNSEYYPLKDYIEYIPKNADKIKIKLKEPKTGFLILSEKYSYYPGWYAKSRGNNLKVLKASDVLTAISLNKDKDIDIYYFPNSFKYGLIISLITLIIIISLLIYFGILKRN